MEIAPPDSEKLQAFADKICERGFGMPALFFLEMYKPLANVAGTLGEGFHPIIGSVFGKQRTGELIELCKDRKLFNEFLDMIEERLKVTKQSGRA